MSVEPPGPDRVTLTAAASSGGAPAAGDGPPQTQCCGSGQTSAQVPVAAAAACACARVNTNTSSTVGITRADIHGTRRGRRQPAGHARPRHCGSESLSAAEVTMSLSFGSDMPAPSTPPLQGSGAAAAAAAADTVPASQPGRCCNLVLHRPPPAALAACMGQAQLACSADFRSAVPFLFMRASLCPSSYWYHGSNKREDLADLVVCDIAPALREQYWGAILGCLVAVSSGSGTQWQLPSVLFLALCAGPRGPYSGQLPAIVADTFFNMVARRACATVHALPVCTWQCHWHVHMH